jgi:MFS family permease
MGKILNLGFLTKEIKISSRKLFAVTILVSGSLAWSFFVLFAFENIFISYVSSPFPVYVGQALFLSFGAISAIIGSLISERVSRRKFLWSWIALGALASASIAAFSETDFIWVSSLLLGVSLGLGYPSFTAVLGDCTVVEERARVSGLVIFVTFVTVLFAAGLVSFMNLGLMGVVVVSLFLRLSSILALILEPCEREKGKKKTWLEILAHRGFYLYLFPWLMFNIAVGLTSFIFLGLTQEYNTAYANGNLMHYMGAGIGAVIAGFVADRFGRKQPIIIGLVMLGISFGFLGLATSSLSLFVYLTISGFAWGFLIVVYLAVPGDVSLPGLKERFYALGIVLPLIIYAGLGASAMLLNIVAPADSLSSVLNIILFLSVYPVLRAKETLAREKISERKMKEYVERVGKTIQEAE